MSTKKKGQAKRIVVRQTRSGIGFDRRQKATLKALGLGKINKWREHPDNPQVRGMVASVRHLVTIEEAQRA